VNRQPVVPARFPSSRVPPSLSVVSVILCGSDGSISAAVSSLVRYPPRHLKQMNAGCNDRIGGNLGAAEAPSFRSLDDPAVFAGLKAKFKSIEPRLRSPAHFPPRQQSGNLTSCSFLGRASPASKEDEFAAGSTFPLHPRFHFCERSSRSRQLPDIRTRIRPKPCCAQQLLIGSGSLQSRRHAHEP
jgi:hypothetical protein